MLFLVQRNALKEKPRLDLLGGDIGNGESLNMICAMRSLFALGSSGASVSSNGCPSWCSRTSLKNTSHKSSQFAGFWDERLTAARATLSENGETLQRVLRHALPVRLGVQLRLGGQQYALPGALESVDGESAGTKKI